MIGPLLHPRRYPPARERRTPVFERLVKVPVGWTMERLCAPFARWDGVRLATPEVAVPVPDLPPEFVGYRIALVSDLHHGPVVPSAWLERVADRAAELAPDLVALGGDFVSHVRSDLDGLEAVLARFRTPDGVVAVLGNHDHWVGPETVAAVVERAGATMLVNRHRLIRRGAGLLAVAGVDDFTHGATRLDEALGGVPPDVPRVLVSHNPDLIEYLPAGLRVDVMLSGHTHNGQIHLPFIGPLTVPSQFGGRYLHGLKRVGETWLYVSAGVGTAAIPIRWGNPPELPVIRLELERH
ncbi:MAG TPA: metallophosphoesterase [Gemmatimonadales bacterium]|nr:metallophosphoesterase [Gemmatimonadales bacterium]